MSRTQLHFYVLPTAHVARSVLDEDFAWSNQICQARPIMDGWLTDNILLISNRKYSIVYNYELKQSPVSVESESSVLSDNACY